MKKTVAPLVLAVALVATVSGARAHCEIPCGIYGDDLRFSLLTEHIATIEKSMKQIDELSKGGDKNYNQIVRWVDNKEKHAEELRHIVVDYFLAQRVKPADPADGEASKEYVKKLMVLHGMVLHSMKAKQTTDQVHVKALRELLAQFKALYQ